MAKKFVMPKFYALLMGFLCSGAVTLALGAEQRRMECHNENNVRFIRHKARDSCHALRLKKRSLAVDVRRQRLEEVVKKLKASKCTLLELICMKIYIICM